jgi:hypothetical protein
MESSNNVTKAKFGLAEYRDEKTASECADWAVRE